MYTSFSKFHTNTWNPMCCYFQLRGQLVGEMGREWERYKNYMTDDMSKEDYLKDMGTDRTYGGEPEILALCNLYGVNTKVYDGTLVSFPLPLLLYIRIMSLLWWWKNMKHSSLWSHYLISIVALELSLVFPPFRQFCFPSLYTPLKQNPYG